MSRILSGIQPTGNIHLGNYLGAIKNWVSLQHDHESLFCIVDLHAITLPQDPKMLRENTYFAAATYIACGVDVTKSAVFPQSAVSGHSELGWILGCHTPLGWLNRMTQFKEKSGKHKDKACLGLYAYPVLQAADILLYKATHVPVGEDQKQHLELARDIAGAFNRQYGQDFFPLPEPQIFGTTTRVMSLRDGSSKMSKSADSEFSRINLTDDNDTIVQKIRKAKTDADPLPSETAALESRPEAENLINIYAAITDQSVADVLRRFEGTTFAPFKAALADALVAKLEPIRTDIETLLKDRPHLDQMMAQGTEKARTISHETMSQVQEMIGLARSG